MDGDKKLAFLVVTAPLFGFMRIVIALYFGLSVIMLGIVLATVFGYTPQFLVGHSLWWPIGVAVVAFAVGVYVVHLHKQCDRLVDQVIAK